MSGQAGVLLETKNLSKNFGAFAAVSGINLTFEPGQIHAVLGENGAGKSTLMKLLFGLHRPSSGEIYLNGQSVSWRSSMDAISHGIGMVQQHFSLVDNLSAIDNIVLGAEVCDRFGRLDREAAIERLKRVLPNSALSVPWYAPVSELTVGQKQRVEILKLLFRESKVLILDEPTAVLTPSEIEELFSVLRALKERGSTIVLITHKLNEVLSVCDSYSVLRAGRLVASGSVAGASVDTIVESMIGRKLPEFDADRPAASQQILLECKNLQTGITSKGARIFASPSHDLHGRVRDVSLKLNAGEIVGIAGVEGSGQSQFVEALFGLRGFSGDIALFGRSYDRLKTRELRERGVALVPEDRLEQGLWLDESCFSNLMIGLEDHFIENLVFQFDRRDVAVRSWAERFDVRAASLDLPVQSLSGGNQQKIIFAREVEGRKPKVLICHQPTRGVDLGAIDMIHRRLIELRNQGLGILVISSELDELLKLSDRLYVFFEGRISREFARSEFDRLKVGAAMTGVSHDV